jgi:hypothetical protein
MGFKRSSGVYNDSMKWWELKRRKVGAFFLAYVIEQSALEATDKGDTTELHVLTCRFGMLVW